MDYTKFIAGYKTAKDAEEYTKKHIIKKYIPYATKLSIAKAIAQNCTHITIDDKTIYKKDTPAQYFTTIMQLIAQYTDIEFDGPIVAEVYDSLAEVGALNSLLCVIPESEVTELRALVDMCVSDIYDNERDLTSFFETKVEAINLSINQMLLSFSDTLAQLKETQENQDVENDFPMNKPVEN